MASEYLVSNLITAARDAGMLPAQTDATDDARVLATLNREQRTRLAALLRKTREEYQNASEDVTLVEGTTRYRIPSRAMGAALKAVRLVTDEGERDLLPCPERRKVDGPGDYFIDGNYVELRGTLTGSSLRFVYPRRLGKLVAATEALCITSINTATNTVAGTLADESASNAPSAWTTAKRFDLIRGTPHFDVLGQNLSCSAVTVVGGILVFSATLPDELAVGDFVALTGESPVCQAPVELHDVLVTYALQKLVRGRKDAQAKKDLDEDLVRLEADALDLLQPRVEDEDEVLVNPVGPGWNRARTPGRWKGWL